MISNLIGVVFSLHLIQRQQMSWTIIILPIFSYLVITDAVLCYNCSNFGDRGNYCVTADIHHMIHVKCPGKKCLYYDLSKGLLLIPLLYFKNVPSLMIFILVFINKKIVRRGCLEVDDQCVEIRETPGNDMNQCVICSWDLCNASYKLSVFYCVYYIVLILVLRILWMNYWHFICLRDCFVFIRPEAMEFRRNKSWKRFRWFCCSVQNSCLCKFHLRLSFRIISWVVGGWQLHIHILNRVTLIIKTDRMRRILLNLKFRTF